MKKLIIACILFLLLQNSIISTASETKLMADTFVEVQTSESWIPYMWGKEQTKVNTANEMGFTGKGVKVAVIDTGFDVTHEEFQGKTNIFPKNMITGEETLASIEEENGTEWWEFWEKEEGITTNHGTGVSGTLLGKNIGIAKDVDLYFYKISSGNFTQIKDAINDATSKGVDIINLSYALYQHNVKSTDEDPIVRVRENNLAEEKVQEMKNAINNAYANGTIVVIPSGNLWYDNLEYPEGLSGSLDNETLLAKNTNSVVVGGSEFSNSKHKRSYDWVESISVPQYDEFGNPLFDNEGKLIKNQYEIKTSGTGPSVDISAPGTNVIFITSQQSMNYDSSRKRYRSSFAGGTSTATPYVTGILALLKQQYPELNHEELVAKLYSCAKDSESEFVLNGGTFDYEFGNGFVQAVCEDPIDFNYEIVSGSPLNVYNAPTSGLYTDFETVVAGTYQVDKAWKQRDDGSYEWYRIKILNDDGTISYKWIPNFSDVDKLPKMQRLYIHKDQTFYKHHSEQSSTYAYTTDYVSGKWSYYGFDWNQDEERYNWYMFDMGDESIWYKKEYGKYKPSISGNGFSDADITTWDDYIGGSEIQEMKSQVKGSDYFASFEEEYLFNKEEYDEIMNKYGTQYKYHYFIYHDYHTRISGDYNSLYLAFSDSPISYEYNGTNTYGTLKSEDGTSFVTVNPTHSYSNMITEQTINGTTNIDDPTQSETLIYKISDQSFYQSHQIHTLQQYYLHDEPNGTPLASSVSPQTLTVVFQYKDWYQINTWLGLKWIQVPAGKTGDSAPTSVNLQITINGTTNVQSYPLDNGQSYPYANEPMYPIQNSTYTATKKYNNWYYFQHTDGKYYWVKNDDVTIGTFTIRLTEQTEFFNQPNGIKESSLSPQDVTAYRRQGDWFEINTWLGKRWINPNNEIVVGAKTVSYSLALTQAHLLHDLPFDNKVLTSQVSPQTINVKAEWTDTSGIKWLKIQTWLGDKWIKMN